MGGSKIVETPADARPVDASFALIGIEAFVAATVTTFEELTGSTVVARAPFLLDRHVVMDVTANVVLRHDPPGRMRLLFPLSVLEALADRYLAGAAPLTAELVDDAAGEFANVIAGQAKTMLKGTPEHFLWQRRSLVDRGRRHPTTVTRTS